VSTADQTTSVYNLRQKVRQFIDDRDWDQFHTPKDLAIGVITEAGELLEHFRFRSEAEIVRLLDDTSYRQALEHELADVLYFVLALSNKLDVDLSRTLAEKMEISARRYPVEKARGKNAKYTEYETGN